MPLVRTSAHKEVNYAVLNPNGKETVTIIHGMFGNLSQFYLSIGPDLAKTYKVLLYDLKSHGKSSKVSNGYDLDSFAWDLVALWDALGISKSHLMGFSFGALVAIRAGVRYPKRIQKITAMEVPPLPDVPLQKTGDYTWDHFLFFAHSLPKGVIDNFFSSERKLKKTYAIYEYIINQTSFIEDNNARKPLSEQELGSLQIETLFLYGNQSICFPELARIKPWIKHQKVHVFNGTHGFFMDKDNKVAELMEKFYGGHPLQEEKLQEARPL